MKVTEVDEERGRLMLSSKAAATADRVSAYGVSPAAGGRAEFWET